MFGDDRHFRPLPDAQGLVEDVPDLNVGPEIAAQDHVWTDIYVHVCRMLGEHLGYEELGVGWLGEALLASDPTVHGSAVLHAQEHVNPVERGKESVLEIVQTVVHNVPRFFANLVPRLVAPECRKESGRFGDDHHGRTPQRMGVCKKDHSSQLISANLYGVRRS